MADLTGTQILIEVVKIASGIATPILVAFLGFQLNRTMQGLTAAQWANQKVIEKRIVVFDELAPLLNDLYCYIRFVGHWKELKPPEVIQKKRQLDKKFYVYASLFPPKLEKLYNEFIDCCFQKYSGPGVDARIRTVIASTSGINRRNVLSAWEEAWDGLFAVGDVASSRDVETRYKAIMTAFSAELGLGLHTSQQAPQPSDTGGW